MILLPRSLLGVVMVLKWNYKEAMRRMDIGDSFFIPTLDPGPLTATIAWEAYEMNIKVVVKRAVSSDAIGIRVWRVEPKVDNEKE